MGSSWENLSKTEFINDSPGQALSYKTGELKILELRDKYQKELGNKFNLKDFHDRILKGGSMPLDILEIYLDEWAKGI